MTGVEVKELAYSLGADICGIACSERFKDAPEGFHPSDVLPGVKSVVVIGRAFNRSLFDAKSNVPYTIVRHKLMDSINDISIQMSFALEKKGFMAVPVPSAEPYEFWDEENRHGRGIISLKHAAQNAGLGFIGKNTLLINKRFGNRLWLGAVLTDAEIEADSIREKACPINCRICIDACPQSALDGTTIVQKKCRKVSTASTPGGGVVLSCNICRKVCPFSKT
jgi:epoxyqueuosine reductase